MAFQRHQELSPQEELSTKEVEIVSDKDVIKEFGKISNGLKDDNDWSRRLYAVQRLQQIAKSASKFPAFVTSLRGIQNLLCGQVVSLRSAIVRAVCAAIEELAQVQNESFEMAGALCPQLLKLTMNSTQVMSTSGDSCMQVMLKCTKLGYAGVINCLLDGLKNRTQRVYCVNYLTTVLHQWNINHLEKYAGEISQFIPSLLQDAQQDVRSSTRSLFWAYSKRFPLRSDKTLLLLNATIRKHLYDDKAAENLSSSKEVDSCFGSAISKKSQSSFLRTRQIPVAEATQDENTSNSVSKGMSSGAQRIRRSAQQVYEKDKSFNYGGSSGAAARVLRDKMDQISGNTGVVRSAKPIPENSDLKKVLSDYIIRCDDSLWSSRVKGFEKIGTTLKNYGENQFEDPSLPVKIVRSFENHILDAHYKVTLSVFENFPYLTLKCHSAVQDRMQWILSNLFQKCCDTKGVVKEAALDVLKVIKQSFDSSVLMNLVLSKLEHVAQLKFKIVTYNFISTLIPTADEFFESKFQFRNFILKCASLIDDKSPVINSIGSDWLVRLYENFEARFNSALEIVSSENRFNVLTVLESRMPEYKGIRSEEKLFSGHYDHAKSNQLTASSFISVDEISFLRSNNNERSKISFQKLQHMVLLITSFGPEEWGLHFEDVLCIFLDSINMFMLNEKASDSDGTSQELYALESLRKVLRSQKLLVAGHLRPICSQLLDCCHHPYALMADLAEKTLSDVVVTPYPSESVIILSEIIENRKLPSLGAGLRTLTYAISSTNNNEELLAQTEIIMPTLVPLLDHEVSMVRRGVVNCLVKLYMKLKEKFLPYFRKLHISKQRLVTMYVERTAKNLG